MRLLYTVPVNLILGRPAHHVSMGHLTLIVGQYVRDASQVFHSGVDTLAVTGPALIRKRANALGTPRSSWA